MKLCTGILIILSFALFTVPYVRAQTPLESVTGVVADSRGSVMPDVKITVTDTERGQSFEALFPAERTR